MRVLVLVVLLVFGASAQAAPEWEQAFAEAFASPHSWERRSALALVDVQSKAGVKRLLGLLADERPGVVDFHVRDGLIERLAEAEGAPRDVLRRGLRAKQARVREGVALALGRAGHESALDALIGACRDPAPRVRRAAVEALARFPERREAIEAVLGTWERAGALSRLGLLCERSLRWMAAEDHGLDPKTWRGWWKGVDRAWPTPAPPPVEARAGSTRTRVRGVELTFTEHGTGTLPLLVIPNFGTTPELYRPWLRAVEDLYRVIYLELPKVDDFPADQVESFAAGLPYYPVDALVEAVDQLRAERGVERFALFAHGYHALIAMRYLSLHAERVDHAILVAPISGAQAWAQILGDVRRWGLAREDPELEHMARHQLVDPDGARDYQVGSDAERQALRRKAAALYLADESDPALTRMFDAGFYDDRDDEAVTPDFELSRQAKAQVPILVQWGERSALSLARDRRRFGEHYPQVTTRVYAESALCPFIEQTAAWGADLRAFVEALERR